MDPFLDSKLRQKNIKGSLQDSYDLGRPDYRSIPLSEVRDKDTKE
jgi:hypothetical protein